MRLYVRNWLALIVFLAVVLCSCSSNPVKTDLTPITVQLRWTHQAQFAGFYAADQNGDYAAEGLKVSFLEGGSGVDMLSPLLTGAAQFGIINADALLAARAEGKPLRAIATLYRRTPSVYMSLAASGIIHPEDLIGKTVAVGPNGRAQFYALLGRVGIRPDQVTVVNPTADLTPLYTGQVQARGVILTNEVLTARAAGYKLNLIFPDDYGIHFYADTLFTTDNLIATQPDLVLRFLRATLKGWTDAIGNPAAVGPMVLKVRPGADLVHENAFMVASLPLINTGEDNIGWMKPEVWAGMEQTLREQKVLTQPLDVTQVYTLQFLKEIYP